MLCVQRCPNDHGGHEEGYQRAWARVLSARCRSWTCWQWTGHTVHEQQEVWGKYLPYCTQAQTHQCWLSSLTSQSEMLRWCFLCCSFTPGPLLSLSVQADFRDYPPLLRQAVSIARKIQDPLMEYAQVCSTDDDILCLKLHPLQVRHWGNIKFLWFYLCLYIYCCILFQHEFFK